MSYGVYSVTGLLGPIPLGYQVPLGYWSYRILLDFCRFLHMAGFWAEFCFTRVMTCMSQGAFGPGGRLEI